MLRLDAAVAEQLVGAGVDGDDAVEDAGVRVGVELDNPALRDVALVGASYGLSTRTLGAVSLVGPVRMDYPSAINSVREAAAALSRFVEELYEA